MPELDPHHPNSPADAGSDAARPDPAGDALAGLKQMSTTAGLGGEYVAINPPAIAAVLLGAASLLAPVFNGDWLLVIPAAGVVCAILAFVQIRRSNGTQTGRGLAAAGLALSVLVGGGTLAARLLTELRYGPDRRQIQAVIARLGQEIGAAGDAARSAPPDTRPATAPSSGPSATAPATAPAPSPAAEEAARHYDAAYALFSDRFRRRVSRSRFIDAFSEINRSAETGIRSMQWNGRVEFFTDTGSGAPMAVAVALVTLTRPADPPRQTMMFAKVAGVWQIDDLPLLFPPDRPARPRQ